MITYKHLEFTTRENGIVDGKATIFIDNQMYQFTSISKSEAESLCDLNKQINLHVKKWEELNS